MKNLILIAGAAALASAGPALAKPAHAGHGKNPGNVPLAAQGFGAQYGKGKGGCPPGHSKNPLCMPPGQYKKMFEIGQSVPLGYRRLVGYNALPQALRNHYGPQLDPASRYAYDNAYLYRVDPRTMVVQQVLNAILRP